MQPKNRDWLVPLTGVAFIVVGAISFIVGGSPKSADHPPAVISAWYIANKDSVQAGAFIGVAAVVLLVFFGAYLRRLLRAAAPDNEFLSLVSFAGILLVAVGAAIDTTILIALSEAADDINPVGVQSLQALWDNDFVPLAMGCILFLLGTGLSVLRSGVLPKWSGWVMVLLGILGLTPIGFVAAIGAALVVLVLSIALSLRARKITPGAVQLT
jgi:hypothetical protein